MKTDWYALRVHGKYDHWMRRHGLDPFVPTETRTTFTSRHHSSLRRTTTIPLFPGLAFVHMAQPRLNKVLAIPYVTGIFMPYGEPYRFLAADMATLGALGGRPALLPYGKGDAVRLVRGPLVDVTMEVADVDFRTGEVALLAKIMGAITRINTRAADVRRAVA